MAKRYRIKSSLFPSKDLGAFAAQYGIELDQTKKLTEMKTDLREILERMNV